MHPILSIAIAAAVGLQLALQIKLLMNQQELRQALTDANAKVEKIATEVQALKDTVGNADNVPQEVVDAVNNLAATLQRVDDINPDEGTPENPEARTPPR